MKINLDNPIIRFLSRVFDVCLTTVYFLLCSIPVVTFGASFAAMQATMLAIIADEYSGVTEKFFSAFRENFRQATVCWLAAAVVGLVLFINIRICWGIEQAPGAMLSAMRGITVFCAAFYVSMFVYLFAGLAKYVVTVRQAFDNALLWTFRKLHWTLLLVILWVGILICIYLAWIWAFPFVAAGLYLQAQVLFKAFGLTIDPREDA